MTARPNRYRASVESSSRLVTLQGRDVPVEGESTTLHGWTMPPLGPVLCVKFDDGRELLVARKDVVLVDDLPPDTERGR